MRLLARSFPDMLVGSASCVDVYRAQGVVCWRSVTSVCGGTSQGRDVVGGNVCTDLARLDGHSLLEVSRIDEAA